MAKKIDNFLGWNPGCLTQGTDQCWSNFKNVDEMDSALTGASGYDKMLHPQIVRLS